MKATGMILSLIHIFQVFLLVMGVYLSFSLIISFFLNWYNRRIALVER